MGKSLFFSFIALFSFVLLNNAEGVLVSERRQTNPIQPVLSVEEVIEQFVQQSFFAELVSQSGDIIKKGLQSGQLQLMPAIATQTINQIATEVFKYEPFRDKILEAYRENHAWAQEEFNNKTAQSEIQSYVAGEAKRVISEIREEKVFQYMVDEIIKQGYVMQQRIGIMAQVQQQAQLAILAQQQYAQQLAMAQMYQQAVIATLQQRSAKAQAQMQQQYENQVRNAASREQRQQIQQQYEQAFIEQQRAIEELYRQSLR